MSLGQDNPTDAELVRAARQGDRAAYEILVGRHLRRVYATALRILCNDADAEDTAQDTFIRAFDKLDLYDPRHPFGNWLLKIATNLAINRLRSRRRERVLKLHLADKIREFHPPEEDRRLNAKAWRHWLDQLSEPQRVAIVLFHFHQMPYAEIAEVMEMPTNSVRTHLHRGRQRLKELMADAVTTENGSWEIALPNN